MRPNGNHIRHFKCVTRNGQAPFYCWNPPKFARRLGKFKFASLGRDRDAAARRAEELNEALDQYVRTTFGGPPKLDIIKPMTTAWLARLFEASPKFASYSSQTKEYYSRSYRRIEVYKFDGSTMFGDLLLKDVTRQIAFGIYEHHSGGTGPGNGEKITSAWQAAFKYASLKLPEVNFNPFTQLCRRRFQPRRQRWTEEQLNRFLKAADWLGCSSVGLCALLCMELAQRPCDVRNLTWSDYDEAGGYIRVRQTKQHVEVRIPPTRRLADALRAARTAAEAKANGSIDDQFICPTKRGKRWQRRELAREVRLIARSVGLPDELQIRDLRRTAATEAASAGVTPWEMMAAGGWQNQASIRPYLIWTPEQAASFQAKREAYRSNQKKTDKAVVRTQKGSSSDGVRLAQNRKR